MKRTHHFRMPLSNYLLLLEMGTLTPFPKRFIKIFLPDRGSFRALRELNCTSLFVTLKIGLPTPSHRIFVRI